MKTDFEKARSQISRQIWDQVSIQVRLQAWDQIDLVWVQAWNQVLDDLYEN